MRTADDSALWVTSWPFPEYVKHEWAGAWVNSLFRRESGPVASDLIREAVAVTRHFWEPPEIGLVTFVDASKVKRKRDPGRCYRKAGFQVRGRTKSGLICLGLDVNDMPDPISPAGGIGGQTLLFRTEEAAGLTTNLSHNKIHESPSVGGGND